MTLSDAAHTVVIDACPAVYDAVVPPDLEFLAETPRPRPFRAAAISAVMFTVLISPPVSSVAYALPASPSTYVAVWPLASARRGSREERVDPALAAFVVEHPRIGAVLPHLPATLAAYFPDVADFDVAVDPDPESGSDSLSVSFTVSGSPSALLRSLATFKSEWLFSRLEADDLAVFAMVPTTR